MISFASISRGVSDALGSLQLEPIHGPCVKTNGHDRAPEAHVITMRGGGYQGTSVASHSLLPWLHVGALL